MLGFLRTWVINIVTIIIFITFLEILLPNSSIKKYIKMIVGLLVMLVILNPLLELANGRVKIENEIIKSSSYLEQKSLALNVNQLEEQQNQQAILLYRQRIEGSIKERVEYENKVKVVGIQSAIDEDTKSKGFGSLKELNITLTGWKEEAIDEKNMISPIVISIGNKKQKISSVSASDIEFSIIDKVKSNISDLYGLSKDSIHIELQ